MTAPKERTSIKVQQERAVLAAVHLPDSKFDARDPLGELRSLAETAGATCVGELLQRRQSPDPGTYIGSGKLDELRAMCEELDAGLVIFDHEMSPSQIANVEEAIGVKVVDRSELILDIFANRATTHEAKLQVELAQLQYTYPRLRAMWDHLERIVGAGGIGGIGTRGPGEQQLEIDRRLVRNREGQLRRELSEIQARRRREVRARNAEHFTVGLVGYTNAGKSTLFNSLTQGGAFAANQLFSTLITRTRDWNLGGGVRVLLSDTVGFIRDLPHHLVASFRATLEEATHADLLLMVLDVSDPTAEMQYQTVSDTLDELFEHVEETERAHGESWTPPERLVLLNKADLLRDNADLLVWQRRLPDAIAISAINPGGTGHAELIEAVRARAIGPERDLLITLPLSESRAITAIENRAIVRDRQYHDASVTLTARIGERQLERLRAGGARFSVQALA